MTTIDPPINAGTRTHSIRSQAATAAPAPSTTDREDATRGDLPEGAPAAADRLDTVPGMTFASRPAALGSSGSEEDERALLDDVLARFETETGLDDLRRSIESMAQQRQALADRRMSAALELSRSTSPGLGLGGGELDSALWRPGISQQGEIPMSARTAAERYVSASTRLQQAESGLTSGGGVRLLDSAERGALEPPAFGDVFITEGDYRIDYKGHETRIYEKDENGAWKQNTRIWGDPHVDELSTGKGDDWHFGEDSTFILPDGTKLSLNTQETKPGNGIYFTVGIDIQSGTTRAYAGKSFEDEMRSAGVAEDRVEFDAKYADTKGTSGGVFALVGGQWAMLDPVGFRDVETESWKGYLDTRNVVGRGEILDVTDQQRLAVSGLRAADRASLQSDLDAARADLGEHAFVDADAIEGYRAELRSELNALEGQMVRVSQSLSELVREAGAQVTEGDSLDSMVEETYTRARQDTQGRETATRGAGDIVTSSPTTATRGSGG